MDTTAFGAAGVYSESYAPSAEGATIESTDDYYFSMGLWADTSYGLGVVALAATTDNGAAGVFFNNSPSGAATVYAQNDLPTATGTGVIFDAVGMGGNCEIDTLGDLACTGTISGSNVIPAAAL